MSSISFLCGVAHRVQHALLGFPALCSALLWSGSLGFALPMLCSLLLCKICSALLRWFGPLCCAGFRAAVPCFALEKVLNSFEPVHMTRLKPKRTRPRQENTCFCQGFELLQHMPYRSSNRSSISACKKNNGFEQVCACA